MTTPRIPRKRSSRNTLDDLEREFGIQAADPLAELEREFGLKPVAAAPEKPLSLPPAVVMAERPRPLADFSDVRAASSTSSAPTTNNPAVRTGAVVPRGGGSDWGDEEVAAVAVPKPSSRVSRMDEFSRSIERTAARTVGDIAGGLETVLGGSDNPSLTAIPRKIRKLGQGHADQIPAPKVARASDVNSIGTGLQYGAQKLGEAVTSTVPLAAAAVATGGIGAFALGGAMAAGAIRTDLEELGVTDEATIRKVTAIVAPIVAGLDTRMPAGVAKQMLRAQTTSTLRRIGWKGAAATVAKSAGKNAAVEAGTEVAQEGAQYVGTRTGAGKPMSMEEFGPMAVEAAIGGALGGATFGGAGGVVEAGTNNARVDATNRQYDAQAEAMGMGAAARRPADPKPSEPDAVPPPRPAEPPPPAPPEPQGPIVTQVPPQAPPEHRAAAAALEQVPPGTILRADDPSIAYRPEDARPTQTYYMHTADIERDPAVMQYKGGVDSDGVTDKLKRAERFNPQLSPPLYVWREPETGRVLVANGHHRHELAERTGYPVLEVKFLEAKTAKEARGMAALQNIGEGQGTAIDAARFFRETGKTREDVRAAGIPMTGSLAGRGMALTTLSDEVFDLVNRGVVQENQGVLIGQTLQDPANQMAAAKILATEAGRDLTQAQVQEVLEDIRRTGTERVFVDDMFGGRESDESIIVQRAKVIDGIRRRLRSQRALLNTVANEVKAEILSSRGVASVNVTEAEAQAQAITKLDEALTLVSHDPATPVFRLLSDAARRVKNGESTDKAIAGIEADVHAALRAVFTGRVAASDIGGTGAGSTGRAPDGAGTAAAGADEEVEAPPPPDPNQEALFSPIVVREGDDYRGYHQAPDAESGAPMHDMAKLYPDDLYGPNGARYYGDGSDSGMDAAAVSLFRSVRGKPNAKVTVYRAVPDSLTPAKRLAKLEKQAAAYLRRHKVPEGRNPKTFYEEVTAEIEALRNAPATAKLDLIRPGDWVTPSRGYAKMHGESNLNGEYTIVSKTVRASELFTEANSLHEFGYQPAQPAPAVREGARDVTQTPEFRRWFGNSVVKYGGKPLEVYHGGEKIEDGIFRMPAFFTSSYTGAQWFAREKGDDDTQVEGVYLSIQNPIDMNTKEGQDRLYEIARSAGVEIEVSDNEYGRSFYSPTIAKHSFYDGGNDWDLSYIPAVREALLAAGYDGMVGDDVLENGSIPTWVAFKPEQIKSSERNAGTFDPESPSIVREGATAPFYGRDGKLFGSVEAPDVGAVRERARSGYGDPERILKPVVRVWNPDGKTYTVVEGRYHAEAWDNAIEQGLKDPLGSFKEADEGFSTTQRDFVERETALEIAEAAEQLRDNFRPGTTVATEELEGIGQIGDAAWRGEDTTELEKQQSRRVGERRMRGYADARVSLEGTKVADRSGKPKIVYHGTMKDFKRFKPTGKGGTGVYGDGFYFAESPEHASEYAFSDRMGKAGDAPNVRPARLLVRNPFRIEEAATEETIDRVRKALNKDEREIFDGKLHNFRLSDPALINDDIYFALQAAGADVSKALQAAGFDGITYLMEVDLSDYHRGYPVDRVWMVWNRDQVVSAFDDPKAARIVGERAFHGTRHEFDQFSLDKVGTGEGAQVYGWGLYFASELEVAKYYRKMLTGGGTTLFDALPSGGKTIPGWIRDDIKTRGTPAVDSRIALLEAEVKRYEEQLADWERQAEQMKKNIDAIPVAAERSADEWERWGKETDRLQFASRTISTYRGYIAEQEAELDELRELKKSGNYKLRPAGRIFAVDIPDASEYLPWDTVVPRQMREKLDPEVLESVAELMQHYPETPDIEDLTGRELYQALMRDYGEGGAIANLAGEMGEDDDGDAAIIDNPKEAVSRYLASRGIAGMIYLDEQSRFPTPYDPALGYAAKSFKDDGQPFDQALVAMQAAYPKQPVAAIRTALADAYGVAPPKSYNYVVFDDKLIQVVDANVVAERARRSDPDQMELAIAFGSLDAQEEAVTELLELTDAEFVTGSLPGGVKTTGEQLKNMKAARRRNAAAWTTLRGQKVAGMDNLVRLLQPFRSPKFEYLHYIFLNDAGDIVSHSVTTSGAIDFVVWAKDQGAARERDDLVRRAKRAGATRLVMAHNHPSGDPTPSGGDIQVTQQVGLEMAKHGVAVSHLVINHLTAMMITTREDGRVDGQALVTAPQDVQDTPDWTDTKPVGAEVVRGPDVAWNAIKDVHKTPLGIVYLDVYRRVIAYSPHKASAIKTLGTWLPQHITAHGAANAIVVTEEGPLMQEAKAAIAAGKNTERVLDVIAYIDNPYRTEGMPQVRSLASQGNMPYSSAPTMDKKVRLFEGPAEDDARDQRLALEKKKLLQELMSAPTATDRARVLARIKAIDKQRVEGRPTMRGAITQAEMAERAKRGETKKAVESVTGIEAVEQSRDRLQLDLVTEADLEAGLAPPDSEARDGRFGNDQSSLFNPMMAPTAAGAALRQAVGLRIAPAAKAKAQIEISRDLARAIGVPLNQGRFMSALRRAAGVYFPFKETIRVLRFDHVATVAHEVGHHVSKRDLRNPTMKGAKARGAATLTKAMQNELIDMGKRLYGSRKPAGGYGEEGIAEWFKFYVTDPVRAKREAPDFTAFVENTVFPAVPHLKQVLDQARDDFTSYTNSSAASRIDAILTVNERVRSAPTARQIILKMYDDLVDWRNAVDELRAKRGVKAIQARLHAYILARLTRGDPGLADEQVKRGVIDFNTRERVTEGIQEILERIPPHRMQAFRRYLIAERVLEVAARGIETGVTTKDAQEIVDQTGAEFREHAEGFWNVSKALLRQRFDAGLLTEASYKAVLEGNQRRVPLYRAFEDILDGEVDRRGKGGKKGWTANTSGLMKMKGSARPIYDPIEGLIQDVYRTTVQVNRAHAAQTLIRQVIKTEGAGDIIEEVAKPQQLVQLSVERIIEQLRDLGLFPEGAKILQSSSGGMAVELENGTLIDLTDEVLQAFNFRNNETGSDRRDLVLPALIEGNIRWFKIQRPELYDAMKGLNREEMALAVRIWAPATRVLRAGATLSLEFIARNPIRDMFTAAIRTRAKGAPPPGYHWVRGLFHALKQDKLYQQWRIDQGDSAAMLSIDRKQLRAHVDELTRGKGAKAGDIVIHPLDTLRLLSSVFENATRIGEYEAVTKRRIKEGEAPLDARAEGALASRDISVDFNMAGVWGRPLNSIFAFFNSTLQGPYLMAQDFRHRPQVVVPRAVAWIMLPSLALYYLQKDDEVYQEIPRWMKDIFWVIVDRSKEKPLDALGPLTKVYQDPKTGEWIRIWRIPKPFEWGILFGTVPERIAEYIEHKDPEALTSALGALVRGMLPIDPIKVPGSPVPVPLPIPSALLPVTEVASNYSFFFDRPILPMGATRAAGEEQVKDYTGEFARLLGDAFNTSPAAIEHLVRGHTGGVGTSVMEGANIATRAVRKAADMEPLIQEKLDARDPATRTPLLRGFTVPPPTSSNAESVNRFYKAWEKAEGMRLAWKSKIKQGRPRAAAEYYEENKEWIDRAATKEDSPDGEGGDLRATYNAIIALKKDRKELLKQPDARQRVTELDWQVIDLAREAVDQGKGKNQ